MRALAAEGRTVMVSSHLMSEMALTADHLLVIGKGRLIADTSMDEFVRSSSRQVGTRPQPVGGRAGRPLPRGRCHRPGRERLRGGGRTRGRHGRRDRPDVIEITGLDSAEVGRLAAAHSYAKFSVSERLSWDPTGVSGAGMAIAQLAIAVLGVLCISSEYSSAMIRTSLIAVPKRGRVLAAKSLVFAGVTFVVGEVTSFAAFFVGQALISGHASHAALGDPGVARAVVGGWLYPAAWRCSASPRGPCSGTRPPRSPA